MSNSRPDVRSPCPAFMDSTVAFVWTMLFHESIATAKQECSCCTQVINLTDKHVSVFMHFLYLKNDVHKRRNSKSSIQEKKFRRCKTCWITKMGVLDNYSTVMSTEVIKLQVLNVRESSIQLQFCNKLLFFSYILFYA